MHREIVTITDELRVCHNRIQALVAASRAADREFSDAEQREIDVLTAKMEALDRKRQREETLVGLLANVERMAVKPGSSDGWPQGITPPSLGEVVTKHPEYLALATSWPTGRGIVADLGIVPFSVRAAALTSPAGPPPGWAPGVSAPPPAFPEAFTPRVAMLFSQEAAESGRVSYLRDPGQTKVAVPVAEGTAKPEATLLLPQIDVALATIPVWGAASQQTTEDVANFRQWVDGTFRLDVLDKLDSEVLNGTGTAPSMAGLLGTAGLAGPITFTAPETAADAIARGISAVVQKSGRMPDAIAIAPNAYTALITTKASTSGVYLSGSPITSSPTSLLWGLPVVSSPAVPSGEAVVGAWRRGGTLYTKGGLRFSMSTSHLDFFTKNLVAFLAEIRAVLGVTLPGAFARVQGLPVTP